MAADRRDLTTRCNRFAATRIYRQSPAFEILEAHDRYGHPVVLKQALILDELGRRRFMRETQLGNCLGISGLATVLDYDYDWIAFEHLADTLQTNPPPWDETKVCHVLQKVATTLVELHAAGVVHRDLKPAHILFRGREPVLIDLGVAGLVADDPLEGSEIVGSPAWMAPEQALGAPPTPAADVWSFCAVAYWLLCGQAVYAGDADSVLKTRQNDAIVHLDLGVISNHPLAELLAAGFGPAERRPRIVEFAEVIDCARRIEGSEG